MAKGATCPGCGFQTWQKDDRGARFCTYKKCGARGWFGTERPTGGGGKGKTCESCKEETLVLVDNLKPEIRFCTNCSVIVVFAK